MKYEVTLVICKSDYDGEITRTWEKETVEINLGEISSKEEMLEKAINCCPKATEYGVDFVGLYSYSQSYGRN